MKGCPDYRLDILSNGKIENYLFLEVKIKTKEFQKTKEGGITKDGSKVPNYGCVSYYLDIEPVLHNMNMFAEVSAIPKSAFVILFVSESLDKMQAISLKKINKLAKEGWVKNSGERIELGEYGEGYGRKTLLIWRIPVPNAQFDLSLKHNTVPFQRGFHGENDSPRLFEGDGLSGQELS